LAAAVSGAWFLTAGSEVTGSATSRSKPCIFRALAEGPESLREVSEEALRALNWVNLFYITSKSKRQLRIGQLDILVHLTKMYTRIILMDT